MRWLVFRVDRAGRTMHLHLCGSAEVGDDHERRADRDRAILDVAVGPGEYAAVPDRWGETVILHEDRVYRITSRGEVA